MIDEENVPESIERDEIGDEFCVEFTSFFRVESSSEFSDSARRRLIVASRVSLQAVTCFIFASRIDRSTGEDLVSSTLETDGDKSLGRNPVNIDRDRMNHIRMIQSYRIYLHLKFDRSSMLSFSKMMRMNQYYQTNV